MTKAIRNAFKRFALEYDFESFKEFKEYAKDMTGDVVDKYWFTNPDDEEMCYKDLEQFMNLH